MRHGDRCAEEAGGGRLKERRERIGVEGELAPGEVEVAVDCLVQGGEMDWEIGSPKG